MSEASTLSEEDLERQILELQRAAVVKKREGDIESAKQLLLESKKLRVQLENARTTSTSTAASTRSATTGSTTTTSTTTANVPPRGEQNDHSDNTTTDDVEDPGEKDEDLLKELNTSQSEESNDQHSLTGTNAFSLDEMADLEMMTEFAKGGLPTPSLHDYLNKIDECKQAALTFKHQGQTQHALDKLRLMKQLQAVHGALESILGRNLPSSVPALDEETSEDKELLRELLGQHEDAEILDFDLKTCLDHDDLLQMDVAEIKDALDLGMKLPSLASIKLQVEQQKALALKLKQSGDLDGAKVALIKSKMWAQKASSIEHLIRQAKEAEKESTISSSSTIHQIQEEELERLLEADESAQVPEKQSDPQPITVQVKSSDELRQEAIRLRDEKKTAEATAVLKLYKEALAREAEENERKAQDEICSKLQNEILLAKLQQRRFFFYQQLCDATSGSQQIQAWGQYVEMCAEVAQRIKTFGSKSVTVTTQTDSMGKLRFLPDDLTSTIQNATDPTEERIEVSILDITELHKNKVYQERIRQGRVHSIRLDVHVSIQLPLSESETDSEHPIDLVFRSSSTPVTNDSIEPNTIHFEERQYVTLVRGESKFAKLILRRLERRKITITVDCYFIDKTSHGNKRSGWFGGNKKQDKDESKESLNLGKIVLETRTLLDHNCIVGTFPLLGTGKRHIGGTVGLCIRTGVSFTANRLPDGDSSVATPAPGASTFTGLQGLPSYTNALDFSLVKSELAEPVTVNSR